MINNLKIIEDDDDSILSFSDMGLRFSYSMKIDDYIAYSSHFTLTKIHRWNEKWSYEKEIECEERCQRLFK